MKLINSTFTLNGVRLSILQGQENISDADDNLKKLIGAFSRGGMARDIHHNVVVHGADGPGESLNKIKKVVKPKAKKPKKK